MAAELSNQVLHETTGPGILCSLLWGIGRLVAGEVSLLLSKTVLLLRS